MKIGSKHLKHHEKLQLMEKYEARSTQEFHMLRTDSQSQEEKWGGKQSTFKIQWEIYTDSYYLSSHVISCCRSTLLYEDQNQCSYRQQNHRVVDVSFSWQALWRCWFSFLAGLSTCPHCQKEHLIHLITMETDRNSRSSNAAELKATIIGMWVFLAAQQCHRLPASIVNGIHTAIHEKETLSENWMHAVQYVDMPLCLKQIHMYWNHIIHEFHSQLV